MYWLSNGCGFKPSTAKVVCGSETRQSHAKALQPGNREWVTAIVTVNAVGWVLPAQIIFAAVKHQSLWYHELPEEYVISVSNNGWTTDQLGVEWLQKLFEPNTASQTIGRYRLLIMDGHGPHGSHATAEFDRFCMEKKIIPLYMPPHSSHLLQPLDVSCFSPLKRLYGQKVQEQIQKGIYSVGKEDFIHIYPAVHQQSLSSLNIQWLCSNWLGSFYSRESSLKDSKDTNTTFHISQQSILWCRSNTRQSISTGTAEEED
ncbi:uncharacterized protein ASPGLDRAFT_772433 [Aspergillus glaucus CBS 516.65]|uniref:DDE-1 domain-containing protein n=1 Tax=Aspergillus glaucus CBS 516.65 TaxID=1160497 RepID=A0A1L9VAZ6_ASPGL|nr:hypothetical protein ASPGLDRAFT_772433 [Aspergillus glaucus CBS 516.65]OJJ81098.1 hypothetical protein ASPGLDRAFT_772433 [Aspergillus glaucus CBS 516.65]